MAQGEQEQGPQRVRTRQMEGLRQWKQIPVQGIQFWGAGRKLHKPGACVQAEEEPRGRTTGGMVGKCYVCSHVETTPLTREEEAGADRSLWKEGGQLVLKGPLCGDESTGPGGKQLKFQHGSRIPDCGLANYLIFLPGGLCEMGRRGTCLRVECGPHGDHTSSPWCLAQQAPHKHELTAPGSTGPSSPNATGMPARGPSLNELMPTGKP